MAAITQVIDERIVEIRRERAELDALRVRLEKKEEELTELEERHGSDVASLNLKKQMIEKQIKEAEKELEELRNERFAAAQGFGEEISDLYAEKSSENAAKVSAAKKEVQELAKKKEELERAIKNLEEERDSHEESIKNLKTQMKREKELALTLAKNESDDKLTKMNMDFSSKIHALEEEKQKLEEEIAALKKAREHKKSKLDEEMALRRESQIAELALQRNEAISRLENEKEKMALAMSEEKRKLAREISETKQEFEKELLKVGVEKQRILDDIKMLEYKYEKQKSENILEIEKFKANELSVLETKKTEALTELEAELLAKTLSFKKESAEEKAKHIEKLTRIEDETRHLENRKLTLLRETEELQIDFEHEKSEYKAQLELLRGEKLKEIDEERFRKLREAENQRQIRLAEIEDAYIKKTGELDKKRAERLDAITKSISAAELELENLVKKRRAYELEVNQVRLEGVKISEENAAKLKTMSLEKRVELEKMARDKLEEVEIICSERIARTDSLITQLEARRNALEDEITENSHRLSELKREVANLSESLMLQKESKLAQIQEETIEMSDKLSKLRIQKLSEIDDSLEKYKNDRMKQIQDDFNKQIKLNFKTSEELKLMNQDYQRRAKELRENEVRVEAEKNNIEFKEARHKEEVAELKRLLGKETDLNRKEMALLIESKDQQIQLLQEQLSTLLSAEVALASGSSNPSTG